MSPRTVHVGVDLAWGLASGRTGVAALDESGAYLASATVRTDDEIVEWTRGQVGEAKLGVVAIDAPIVVPNEVGRRDCEQEIHRHFGRFDAGAHSTNRSKPTMNPPRAETLVERIGLGFDPASNSRTDVAIEVYPHPAMVGLWGLDLILKYKHKTKYEFDFRRTEFLILLSRLAAIESLALQGAPRWTEIVRVVDGATTHGELNRVEDEVDGIVCAYLAWLWAERDERLTVYGDVERGYIVAPLPPSHAARGRAARVTPRRQVRFEEAGEPGPRAVQAAPAFSLDGPTDLWELTPDEAHLLERTLTERRSSMIGVRA
ncbi:DUF429 domain-containing protein [Agrococcus beijingensis]|uniref:DUF429 domain-containing protein n=1 Tax=Agrococcus beijingensis TaxID=3068634 RepID=UPI002741B55C|nr:DUF429 domain-containing protein [Agrococcus sp. REN33]